jgi:hypothetical protein
MNSSNRPFYKGLQGFTRQRDDLLMRDAQSSVYYWWWAFMRLSPVFWYANQTGLTPINPAVANTYEQAGDLKRGSFDAWWQATGRHIFAEAKRPANVRLIDVDEIETHVLYEKSLVIEVPLTISRATLLKQFKKLLANEHEGRSLDIAATSQAMFKLHTKRFNVRTLEIEYWVLLYKLLHEGIAIWRIGDRLQIAPSLRVRGVQRDHVAVRKGSSAFDKLHSLTGRYLYKAKFTQLHAEQGSFPNATKASEISMPFGAEYDRDYRAATGQLIGVESAWHEWLQKEFAFDLRDQIFKRNHIENNMRMLDVKTRRLMTTFIDGTGDVMP